MSGQFKKRLVTAEQMKEAEAAYIGDDRMKSLLLMEHAAIAVTKETAGSEKVLLLVGPGKNGADAVAVGRLLLQRGVACDFLLFYEAAKCEELLWQWGLLSSYDYLYGQMSAFAESLPDFHNYDCIVDGVFGIGLNRELSPAAAQIFSWINRLNKRPKVVAIDVPSGINATSGNKLGEALRADTTVTFSFAKTGLLLYPGRKYVGKLIIADIGIPEDDGEPEYITYNTITDCGLPERDMDGNKGSFGKLSLVAGSKGMPGAACLAAKAMYRSGAGLVRVITDSEVLPVLHGYVPEAIAAVREDTYISDNPFAGFDNVIVIGPGLGTDSEAERLLDLAIQYGKRLVLDADALNILAKRLDGMSDDTEHRLHLLADWLPEETIITPHPGEMSRLLNVPVSELKENPLLFAKMIRRYCDFVWVWKDACSMVIHRDGFYLNQSGNEAMGTAGSGDVLAGACGAMAAADMPVYQAACAAVYVHGLAGDYCKKTTGSRGTMAGDIADAVGTVLRELD